MKNGIVIADSGPIISLATVGRLDILDKIFDEVKIPGSVWEELTRDDRKPFVTTIKKYFEHRVYEIKSSNDLIFILDYGESESIILYKELKADFLLIDDKKARDVAERLNINCIGTLGLLVTAKEKGIIKELRTIFLDFLNNKRFYSIELLNFIMEQQGEKKLL